MIGVRKTFSKTLFNKNDPQSRKLVKEFFAKRGIVLTDHPNQFDVDLATEDKLLTVEVERRPVWTDEDFPFPTVNILERKKKFFEEGKNHYCIISENYKRLGFIDASVIKQFMKDEFLKENPNKYVKHGEYVYQIPTDKFEWYNI